jgi:DNA-binding response OmpR family regulator
MPPGIILILDQFESYTQMDSWLRREFMPVMIGHLKLLVSGRLPPDTQWVINPLDHIEFSSLKLNSLSFSSAVHYLEQQGHSAADAASINHFANGHPLALQLASSVIRARPERCLSDVPSNEVTQTLVDYFAEDILDPAVRQALEAASVVRRINEAILSEMLDIDSRAGAELYEQLGKIDFIERREDGLSLHEVLKNVLSARLKARYPANYGLYRRRASRRLLKEMQLAPASQLWRYTADILYLVENPVIRSAFSPPDDVGEYSAEPARETVSYPSWFDLKARQVNLHGNKIDLTPLEFGTLELLMSNQGAAVSRKELLRQVWDIQYEGSSNVVDTIIRSLRKKLYEQSSAIQAVRGVGYRYMQDR